MVKKVTQEAPPESNNQSDQDFSILQAIGRSATALLNNEDDAVDFALKNILNSSKAGRIYIFENFEENDELFTRQIHEICAPGTEPQINNPELQRVSFKEGGYSRWFHLMQTDRIIKGHDYEFPDGERELLAFQGIKSILIFPLFVNGNIWGSIGFDYTTEYKNWSDHDLLLLRLSSELFSAYFQNMENAQKIISQNKKLIQLISDQDMFFQILAHDLRNPMSNLIGFADILHQNLENYTKKEFKKFVGIIYDISKKTHTLLNDLLLWSRSRKSDFPGRQNNINLNLLCQEVITEFKSTIEDKHLTVVAQVDTENYIRADKNLLKVILRNLVSNALKYTPRNGNVIIHSEENEIHTMLSVTDDGTGFSQDKLSSLWKLNTRVGTDESGNEQIRGLGLHICKELTEQMGGSIEVESIRGQGSKVTLTIPKKDPLKM